MPLRLAGLLTLVAFALLLVPTAQPQRPRGEFYFDPCEMHVHTDTPARLGALVWMVALVLALRNS
jgi:hypothetical protein